MNKTKIIVRGYEQLVAGPARHDLGVAGHDEHPGAAGRLRHAFHHLAQQIEIEPFLKDEAAGQISGPRAEHGHVVDRAVHRQGADVAAGEEQRGDGIPVRTHGDGTGKFQLGGVVQRPENGIVELFEKEFVDEPLGGPSAAAAIQKKCLCHNRPVLMMIPRMEQPMRKTPDAAAHPSERTEDPEQVEYPEQGEIDVHRLQKLRNIVRAERLVAQIGVHGQGNDDHARQRPERAGRTHQPRSLPHVRFVHTGHDRAGVRRREQRDARAYHKLDQRDHPQRRRPVEGRGQQQADAAHRYADRGDDVRAVPVRHTPAKR